MTEVESENPGGKAKNGKRRQWKKMKVKNNKKTKHESTSVINKKNKIQVDMIAFRNLS